MAEEKIAIEIIMIPIAIPRKNMNIFGMKLMTLKSKPS